ncbi:centromere protein U [Sinocyclocheilus anshuiensis]|uniref:Centromere protein U n=1 Tax=Sinocyclocheilus anshuiensis TaxID=1608454 RepID=A0A671Q5S3_9TELE|nr:PREDICTED: centromere protein U [Sinocyclocheilus anshuiensis]
MSRMAKALRAVQRELQGAKQSSDNAVESPQPLDISSIEKTSFFHGDQYSPHGNPLHSTALEEDLSPGPEQNQKSAPEKLGRLRARKPVLSVTDTDKTAVTQAKKIGKAVSDALNKKASSKENQEPPQPTNKGAKSVVRKVKGRPLPTISEGRDNAGKKRTSIPTSYRAKEAVKGQRLAKETSSSLGVAQRQQRSPPSSEELTDEDESFHPSKEKSIRGKRRSSSQRQNGHKQKRKSSTSSERAGPSKKSRDLKSPTDLDVVLDSFQEFVTQYKQTINSEAVKRSIDAVSRSFEEQLSEIITATKQLKNVKRENNKINSTINKKRTRLVEANNELIKGKTKLRILQKDHDEMEQRLKALREGSSLLTNLQELNRKYLKHHKAHPDEVETYGPSCMPAMLMEARCIMGTEHQLKTVNDHLQQVLDETEN